MLDVPRSAAALLALALAFAPVSCSESTSAAEDVAPVDPGPMPSADAFRTDPGGKVDPGAETEIPTPTTCAGEVDEAAVERGVESLRAYHDAPYWDVAVDLCPDADCDCENKDVDPAHAACTAPDGTVFHLEGCKGWNCNLVTAEPIPQRLRPPSSYQWRSNPYTTRAGGDGSRLLPMVDWRTAYWIGRRVAVRP